MPEPQNTGDFEVFERTPRLSVEDGGRCEKPSRYRYQRGCRCPGCVVAQADYKRSWLERKAAEEGRVHGERPCLRCTEPISTLDGASRKEYCDSCGIVVLREQQADYRRRRTQSAKPSTTKVGSASAKIADLPIAQITFGADVRLDEDEEALGDLAASIGELGILQPIIVRAVGDGWEVVAGRRRLAAARIAGLDAVPCAIRDLDDDRAFDVTLAENLHRRDLSWIEVALGYKRLKDRGLQQQQIAALVGKTDSQVSQVLRLLTLPREIQDRVHSREISYGEAARIARRGEPAASKATTTGHEDSTTAYVAALLHWRGRHQRLLAGIAQVIKARDADEIEVRQMLDRLLKLDRQPLPDQEAEDVA